MLRHTAFIGKPDFSLDFNRRRDLFRDSYHPTSPLSVVVIDSMIISHDGSGPFSISHCIWDGICTSVAPRTGGIREGAEGRGGEWEKR